MNILHTRWGDLFALIMGGLLPFAFAPFSYYPLAIVCPAFLLLLWLNQSPNKALWRGFLFGIGFFGVGISWVFISIHDYGNTSAPLAVFITGITVVYLALYPAAQGYFLARFFPKNSLRLCCMAFPCSWVLIEWLRSWIFTGFPWLLLGASQVTSPLHGFAPLIGEYGLSFLVTLSSGLLVYFLVIRRITLKITSVGVLTLVVIWSLAGLLTKIQWVTPQGQPIQVSLVQGNIPQEIKWDPAYLQTSLQRYYELTAPYWNSSLIVWPEAAVPTLMEDTKPFLNSIGTLAQQHHVALITGIPIHDGFFYYNGVIVLGNGSGIYYKRHLVPFGEFVPLESLLRGLIGFLDLPMSNFSAGPNQQADLQAAGLKIAPFICYEIAFPRLVLGALPQSDVLVTVSNDAWFGDSFAPAQHLQIAQMRAQESGRYVIFSNNTGSSAIIGPTGTLRASTKPFETTVLTSTVVKMVGETPFVWLGLTPILVLIALFLAVAMWRERVSVTGLNNLVLENRKTY